MKKPHKPSVFSLVNRAAATLPVPETPQEPVPVSAPPSHMAQPPPAPPAVAMALPKPLPPPQQQLVGVGDGGPSVEEVCAHIRGQFAQGHRVMAAALMNLLAAGPRFEERRQKLTALMETARPRGYLTAEETQLVEEMAAELVTQLGFDPRTQEPPSKPRRSTVPRDESALGALLAGDSAGLMETVRQAQASRRPWAATEPTA